jgi:hypothetical protein
MFGAVAGERAFETGMTATELSLARGEKPSPKRQSPDGRAALFFQGRRGPSLARTAK